MNPPSALFGAMNRERKPFTYTPGGLDLSEIKSERMAKRLMRNAMNQGVPEVSVQNIQSPPPQTNPKAIPNFNCLPVQVFPTINLPANPKSLLRTRSNPDHPRDPPVSRIPQPSYFGNDTKLNDTNYNPTFQSQSSNINPSLARPVSMYEYNINQTNNNSLPRPNYGSNGSTTIATAPILPEISYEAEYCQAMPKNNNGFPNNDDALYSLRNNENISTIKPLETEDYKIKKIEEDKETQSGHFIIEPISNLSSPAPTAEIAVTKLIEDEAATDNEQREVKVVKKQVKKEKKVENGEQNGESNVESDLTIKMPTKKSAAKTETKVEVQKTVLPDGSVEEVKVTTTKTTIDGKTEIKTKTEKTIIPKEETEEIEEEEEQEEENEVEVQEAEEESEVVEEPVVVVKKTVTKETPAENGQKETIIKKEERSETSTTKKVVVVQKEESEEEVEEEEEEEQEEPVVVIKKTVTKPTTPKKEVEEENEEVVEKSTKVAQTKEVVKEKEESEEEEEIEAEEVVLKIESPKKSEPIKKQEDEEKEEEVEEEYEEAEDKIEKVEKKELKSEVVEESKKQEEEESEYTEEEYESEKEEPAKTTVKETETKPQEPKEPKKEEPKEEISEQPVEKPEPKEEKKEQPTSPPVPEPAPQPASQSTQKVPLREPSIPLEKVEDVDIKPIGPTSGLITKSHTENTEIITNSTQQPTGPLSTQTEYNRVENIVTVNRTTKTLDHSYDQITQAGIPTLRTYFAPSRERVGTSPQPSKPYQPVYTPEPTTERRHSLLLDRLSTERQVPSSDIYQNTYQYNNQSYEQQRQWSQEPQSEVVNVSNVKPSKITNQQWYQQNNRDNVIYNNVTQTAGATNQPWSQPASQPPQPQYQPTQPQYQPSYTENTTQEKSTTTNTYQQNTYPTYIPKPTNWVNSNVDNLPSINTNKYSFLGQDTTENYQKSTQQYSSTYVPPPWEQDSNYVLNTSNQNYYQPPPETSTYTPNANQGWKTAPPQPKFSKPPPTAYIPPAPNQSFVKSANVVEPPKIPGRKTYYSEYERRYITVPESTYIPGQTKFQAQPDPSPQYYYDNNEPSEKVEHEWRKELREFTEKTTTQTTQHTTEQTSVLSPWEEEPRYEKTPSAYTPTPTWSQTLRPRSWRERSFESEYVGSQEVSKTNTLGRGRPLSSYGKSEAPIPEKARGVSVDRYNPSNYQSPLMSEHGPVPIHTLTPTPPAKSYHNPNVPAYHTHPRASAEPREQPASHQQPRLWSVDSRGTPVQSRSFKYLQWITGTED